MIKRDNCESHVGALFTLAKRNYKGISMVGKKHYEKGY